jgi:hypothetical protein
MSLPTPFCFALEVCPSEGNINAASTDMISDLPNAREVYGIRNALAYGQTGTAFGEPDNVADVWNLFAMS